MEQFAACGRYGQNKTWILINVIATQSLDFEQALQDLWIYAATAGMFLPLFYCCLAGSEAPASVASGAYSAFFFVRTDALIGWIVHNSGH